MTWVAFVVGLVTKIIGGFHELVIQPIFAPLGNVVNLKLWAVLLLAFGCFFAGCRCAAKSVEAAAPTIANVRCEECWTVLDPQRDDGAAFVLSPRRDDDPPKRCPVAGDNCTCGCLSGGQC